MANLIREIEFWTGATILAVIVVLVFVASVARFAGYPIIWSVDMAQLLFIWLCFFGATRAMRERAHLGVDLLVRFLGRRVRLWLETAMAILFITFMAVLAREGYALTMMNRERLFGDSGLSYAFVTIAVPVGCILLSAAILANLWQAWRDPDRKSLVFTRPDAPAEESPTWA